MGDRQITEGESQQVSNNSHILPEELFSRSAKVASAFGNGLREGAANNLQKYAQHAMENPEQAFWHGAVGTAFGVGLALVNKRLASAAGLLASGEMAFRGIVAYGQSKESINKLATTGTGYEETKKAISSNFGQLSADFLAMSATGLATGVLTAGGRLGLKFFNKPKVNLNATNDTHSALPVQDKLKITLNESTYNKAATELVKKQFDDAIKPLAAMDETEQIRRGFAGVWKKDQLEANSDLRCLTWHQIEPKARLMNLPSKKEAVHDFDEKALWASLSTPKKPTVDLQVRSAKETEHELSGLNFLNKKSPFTTEIPSLVEGASKVQLMSAMRTDSVANNKHLDWALTRLIEKFTHGSDGAYIRMSAKGQSEMIDNLAHISLNVSRSQTAHASNLSALSKVHQMGGRDQQELKLLKNAQEIFDTESSSLGYTPELKINLQRLADAYTSIGEPAQAILTAERLVQISLTGKTTERINALNNLGKVCNNIGATDKSLDAYESALSIARTVKRQDLRLFSMPNSKNLSELHQLFKGTSELDKAERCLKIMEFWNS